jgi:hypothetical protein
MVAIAGRVATRNRKRCKRVGLGQEHVASLEVCVHNLLSVQVQHRTGYIVRKRQH